LRTDGVRARGIIGIPGIAISLFGGRAMSDVQGAFDPETLAVLTSAFDDAYLALPAGQQTAGMRTKLAERILRKASQGERDPLRLRTYALEAASPSMWKEAG
jgi:hypothetical protein